MKLLCALALLAVASAAPPVLEFEDASGTTCSIAMKGNSLELDKSCNMMVDGHDISQRFAALEGKVHHIQWHLQLEGYDETQPFCTDKQLTCIEDPFKKCPDHVGYPGGVEKGIYEGKNGCTIKQEHLDSGCDITCAKGPVEPPSLDQPLYRNGKFYFGGAVGTDEWKLVRHVRPGHSWHPASDQMRGTQAYGGYDANMRSGSSWSIRFDHLSCRKFMFATGNMHKWLIAPASSVYGWYANGNRYIEKSSMNSSPYHARWYRRSGNPEDPWISLNDHGPAIGQGNILYGEANFGHGHAHNVLPQNGGANVFCLQ